MKTTLYENFELGDFSIEVGFTGVDLDKVFALHEVILKTIKESTNPETVYTSIEYAEIIYQKLIQYFNRHYTNTSLAVFKVRVFDNEGQYDVEVTNG
jgi:hypothetical protein